MRGIAGFDGLLHNRTDESRHRRYGSHPRDGGFCKPSLDMGGMSAGFDSYNELQWRGERGWTKSVQQQE